MAELAYGVARTLLEKLGSVAYQELRLAWGMKNDLNKLKENILILKSVLKDAEKKQTRDELLRMWVVRVKQVFNDAVDVLDDFDCEILRRQVLHEFGSVGRKVSRFFSASNPVAFRFSIARKVKKIRERLDEIAQDMAKFQLISVQLIGQEEHSRLIDQEIWQDRMTHSFVDDSDIIGRESDKAQIIDMLLRQDDDDLDVNLSVVPIVGIGGLGKTTLAKSVYNDEQIRASFDLKLWVCVSLDFDVPRIVRDILTSAKREEDFSKMSIDNLQTSLRSILEANRFLIVLDDVWNEDRIKWLDLRSFLTAGAKRSKVMVTTRTTLVSSIMTTSPPHLLKGLSKEDSWVLFFKCAFGYEKRAGKSSGLEDIGKEIVKKCGGVPLALKTLGCLLYSKVEAEWIRVRDNEIWELERDDNRILRALRLSYITMHPLLKQCFAYCSTFQQDTKLRSLDLISIWMALGVLESPNEQIELEGFGKLQFNELCARAFFQSCDHDQQWFNYSCDMHDLIHDLACSITESECCIIKSGKEKITTSVRHLRIFLSKHNLLVLKNLKKLQSIYVDCASKECEIDEFFLSLSNKRFKYLRVFDLQNAPCEVLPSSIGTLKHLRYLNLSGSDIKRLPNSICGLQSLQTLLLDKCSELEELPTNMKNLVSLRTLYVTTKQEYFPENEIGRLKSLRTLLIQLCSNLKSLLKDIKYCTGLRNLMINECGRLDLANEVDEIVIPLNLETLFIDHLPHTTTLPHWLRAAYRSLKLLEIKRCQKLVTLPEWVGNFVALEKLVVGDCEQLHFRSRHYGYIELKLQRLILHNLFEATTLPNWLGGALKSLQHLKIEYCTGLFALSDWLSNCASLNTLYIRTCSQLLALPHGMHRLTSLTDLRISDCEKLELACDSNEVLKLKLQKVTLLYLAEATTLPNWLGGSSKSLQHLKIENCPRLFALPDWLSNCASLNTLHIVSCEQLLALPQGMERLTSLTYLNISSCKKLELACDSNEFHQLKLQRVILYNLPEATASPDWLGGASKSLQHLTIRYCTRLSGLPDWLPNCASLNYLDIVKCEELLALPEGMQRLRSLIDLRILDCEKLELECDSNEVLQLSLRRFEIRNVGVRGLPEWLQGAAHTLEELRIQFCPNFFSLPEWLPNFTSLKTIFICGCRQLSSLPERMSQLTSLTHLYIRDPSMAFYKRYEPQTGENWENIAHIPNVEFH